MLRQRIRKNKNIVKINDNTNIRHIGKNIVHEMLKSGRGVGQAKGHNQVFECTVTSAEGRKPLVAFRNADVVIPGAEVDLGKYFGGPQLVEEVADEWKRVSVPPSKPIEFAVVDAESERPILLLGEEDWHTDRRVSGSDKSFP